MSTAPPYLLHDTVADHAAWEGDRKLLDGVAAAMAPSPFERHVERPPALVAEILSAAARGRCEIELCPECTIAADFGV